MFLKNLFSNKGVLGINARNLLYLKPYNPKKAIKLADDKIKTKQFLSARGVPVPKLYNIIRTQEELEKFDFNTLPETFVIKPNQGFGGEGIIPIVGKEDSYWISAGGKKYTKFEFIDHIRDILDGRFSIANFTDYAFFEQLIIPDERLGKYSYEGLPDIRIVVHNLIPVMAMLRLPTKESNGKANLHQGACAVGIDIGKGEATYIAYKNKIIEELPEGLGKVHGLKIPFWDDILLIASKIQLVTNLGYLAADICIDKNSGPILLEINARAGLGVQIANLAPLRRRLERIEGVKVTTPQKGVRIAKDMFGNVVEKEIASLSGKQIVHKEEQVEIIQKKGIFLLQAKIDTNKTKSVIDEEIAMKNGLLENAKDYDDEKSTLKLKFSLRGKRISTVVDVEKIASEKYKFIVGERDLADFLIDLSSKEKKSLSELKVEPFSLPNVSNYSQVDQKLVQIDNRIKLLFHLRPINLHEEREKFLRNPDKNPQFEYAKLKFDPLELIEELNKIRTDDSPLGKIFAKKKEEISNKIALLEAIDEERFTELSLKLFKSPTEEELTQCKTLLSEQKSSHEHKDNKETISAKEVKEEFEKTFQKYGLQNWKVKLKEEMVSDCVAGKNNCLFVRQDARFSEEKIKIMIIHEILTHILTAENGKKQPYEIFNIGLANYLMTQEGLAMYNVEQQRNAPFSENYRALGLVIGIEMAMQGSFLEMFRQLMTKYNFSEDQAFRISLKLKRGFCDTGKKGAFTKDYMYFKGYNQVSNFVKNGGDIKDLYIGKINIEDLPEIKKIPNIQKATILPDWLK